MRRDMVSEIQRKATVKRDFIDRSSTFITFSIKKRKKREVISVNKVDLKRNRLNPICLG